MIAYIVGALALGILGGYLSSNWGSMAAGVWISDYAFDAALILLLFVMGLAFGLDKDSMRKMRQKGFRILIVPVAVACGSILGGVISALILNIDMSATMAVSAGYGWYTLAGPVVSQLFGADWGTLGFAVNVLRELLTITTISLTAKIDKYAPIAAGGATTMDTTLPIIMRYCGADALVTAFSSGFVLSIMAPFTITIIAMLGH